MPRKIEWPRRCGHRMFVYVMQFNIRQCYLLVSLLARSTFGFLNLCSGVPFFIEARE